MRSNQGGGVDLPTGQFRHSGQQLGNRGLAGEEGEPSHLPLGLASVFVKSFVADWSTFVDLFRLEDEDGEDWIVLRMGADYQMTKLKVKIGPKDELVEVSPAKSLPISFPQSWIRACISLDLEDGVARIAANGEMLEDSSYPELKKLKTKRPGKFTIRVGKGFFGGQH